MLCWSKRGKARWRRPSTLELERLRAIPPPPQSAANRSARPRPTQLSSRFLPHVRSSLSLSLPSPHTATTTSAVHSDGDDGDLLTRRRSSVSGLLFVSRLARNPRRDFSRVANRTHGISSSNPSRQVTSRRQSATSNTSKLTAPRSTTQNTSQRRKAPLIVPVILPFTLPTLHRPCDCFIFCLARPIFVANLTLLRHFACCVFSSLLTLLQVFAAPSPLLTVQSPTTHATPSTVHTSCLLRLYSTSRPIGSTYSRYRRDTLQCTHFDPALHLNNHHPTPASIAFTHDSHCPPWITGPSRRAHPPLQLNWTTQKT